MPGSHDLFLGLDIGGTKCAAVVGSRDGQILQRIQWPSDANRGPDPMIRDICTQATILLQTHTAISAAGVSIGGPLDAQQGIIQSPPNLPGWQQIPLKAILQEKLQLPIRIEHDAAACCLAEFHWGAGRGASRLIYLTCGTGFGAGIVIDGKIYRGSAGKSVEIGHARFREDGPEAFGKRGSVESFCAGASLGKIAAWKFPNRWPIPPTSEELAKLWQTNDHEATEVITINARAVGEVCANLGDLLRPDAILLGSLAMHLGNSWVEIVREKFREEALADTATCRIEPAGLGARLQDCAALVVAVSQPQ
ncbi:MAG TPA: ROK family protein [Tepidisphaeraceae bacterium]|jgi:glucokinase